MQKFFNTTPLPPFSPIHIGNCRLWLNTSDNSAINSGSPTNNDAVSSWKDRSGNAIDFAQGTGARQPVYKTNTLNGKPTLLFSGGQTLVNSTTTGLISEGAAWSWIFIGKCTSIPSAFTFPIQFGQTAASAGTQFAYSNNAGFSDVYWGSNSHYAPFKTTVTNPTSAFHYFILAYNGSGSTTLSNYTFYVDGTSATKTSVSAGGTSDTNNVVGNYQATPDSFSFNGSIAEIIVYGRQLNSDEVTQLKNYILAKYNL